MYSHFLFDFKVELTEETTLSSTMSAWPSGAVDVEA
jgi:hypothetical protein